MAEFLGMGGYAFYVWTSFGATAAVFLWNWLAPQRRRRTLMDAIAHPENDAGAGS